MRRTFEVVTEDQELVTIVVQMRYEVCPRCEGRGAHDCWEGGMTSDEMHEQGPEFIEDYLDGVYDTACAECKGLRVIEVADRELNEQSVLALYDEHMESVWAMEAEAEAERQYFQRAAEAMARW